MLKRALVWLEFQLIGKRWMQRWFEMSFRIGIRGMNYFRGHTVRTSGEVWTMGYVRRNLQALGRPKPLIFDVGANTGQYADHLLQVFGQSMDCHVFEPALLTYQDLVQHFQGQACIHPVQLGFGKEDGRIVLFSNQNKSTIASLYPVRDLKNETALVQEESIELRQLDSYCAEAGIVQIDFLKIDVEGAELDVLLGAEKLLAAGKITYIQFEFGPNNISSRTYMKDFFRVLQGYRIYRVLQDGVRELPAYHEMYEIPLVSNYLAELRTVKPVR